MPSVLCGIKSFLFHRNICVLELFLNMFHILCLTLIDILLLDSVFKSILYISYYILFYYIYILYASLKTNEMSLKIIEKFTNWVLEMEIFKIMNLEFAKRQCVEFMLYIRQVLCK